MSLPSHFDESGAQFAWDSTTLKTAFECERKYYFQYIQHYISAVRSVHLIFGGHYASSIELYHKRVALGDTHDEAVLAAVQFAMISTWVHNLEPDGTRRPGTGHAQEFFSTSKTRENLIRTLVWYFEEFKDSDFKTLIKSDGIPAVEYSFKFEIDNGLVLCGHNDRMVQYDSDSIFIQDQKTTGSTVTPHSFTNYDLDIQMTLYTFAGQATLAMPIKGVMIDIAQVAVGFSRFLRGFTYRTQGYLTEWYAHMLHKIGQVREHTQEFRATGNDEIFPPNFTACTNYGGCEFREVCKQSPEFRNRMLRSNFEKRTPWNPLESR